MQHRDRDEREREQADLAAQLRHRLRRPELHEVAVTKESALGLTTSARACRRSRSRASTKARAGRARRRQDATEHEAGDDRRGDGAVEQPEREDRRDAAREPHHVAHRFEADEPQLPRGRQRRRSLPRSRRADADRRRVPLETREDLLGRFFHGRSTRHPAKALGSALRRLRDFTACAAAAPARRTSALRRPSGP